MAHMTVGTVVQLNSGGPPMTIQFINGDEAYCQWFAGEKVEGNMFPLASLKVND